MDLGALLGVYPVNNRRRTTNGLVLIGVAVVAFAIAIPFTIADLNRPLGPGESTRSGGDMLWGGLIGIGLLGLVFGVILLIRALQTRGHAIHLHERGIVRLTGSAEEPIVWSDIDTVRLQGTEQNRAGHFVGIDFRCAIRLHNGKRFAFSSHTTNATELATAMHDAVHEKS